MARPEAPSETASLEEALATSGSSTPVAPTVWCSRRSPRRWGVTPSGVWST